MATHTSVMVSSDFWVLFPAFVYGLTGLEYDIGYDRMKGNGRSELLQSNRYSKYKPHTKGLYALYSFIVTVAVL